MRFGGCRPGGRYRVITDNLRGYAAIKRLAREERRPIVDLLALARQNDPFFAGSPAQADKARWFADLWRRFGYSSGVHLRRVHYQLVSQEDPRKADGTPYENTEGCWAYLCEAGKAARYLRLVSPDAFEDHRNPDPHLHAGGAASAQFPEWWVNPPQWVLPSIPTDMTLDLSLPRPDIDGYDYNSADQPYHVEIWVEKSTQDDALLPICRELRLNLVTSIGFQSITSTLSLLRRVRAADKPARILYISDFDPAGDGMPVAVARQIEYWLPEYAPGADVKLTPLALTRAQVTAYRLPRIPVKDSDRRKAGFEQRYGEGAVELDALEALHPGALANIVREMVEPYRDMTLSWRLEEAEREAREAMVEAWTEATAPCRADLEHLEAETRAILARHQGALRRLQAALEADLAPVRERLKSVWLAVQEARDEVEMALPERPEPETRLPDEGDWLFDSGRDYVEQLAIYGARKNRQDGDGASGI